MRKLLLAMGSDILMDEAVSIMLAGDMKISFPDFTLQYQLAGGMEMIGLIAGHDLVIIFDTIMATSAEPGRITLFSGYENAPTLHLQNPHDTGFSDALQLGAQLGYQLPEKIVVLAVGIRQRMTASTVLSQPMAIRYDTLLAECREIIRGLVP